MNSEFSAPLARHLAESVRAMRRRYRKRLARCQKKFSEEAVHELRIETRRLLALLDLLRALRVGDAIKKTRKEFKRRLDAFDELRDTHVQLTLLDPLWRQFPEARDLDPWLRRREADLIRQLRHEISATRQGRWERRLKALQKQFRKLARKGDAHGGDSLVVAALTAAFAEVTALRARVRRERTETIHQLRVAFKRFRYLSELLQPLLPRLTNRCLRRMQQYQATMGDIQDMEVLLAGIEQARQERVISAATGRALRRELRRRRRQLTARFWAAIDELAEFSPLRFARRSRERF